MSEQSYRSAGTLLAQLASGETTSVALVNHYFSRMAQFNKPLNALVLSGGFVSKAPMYVMRGEMPIRTMTHYMTCCRWWDTS